MRIEAPDATDHSATTRFNRRLLAYRALLVKAGLSAPSNVRPITTRLFKKELLGSLRSDRGNDPAGYANCATILEKSNPSWNELAQAFELLRNFIHDSKLPIGRVSTKPT